MSITRPSPDVMPYIMPIDIDPPRQRTYRKQVNPHLTVKALVDLEGSIREVADELIDGFASVGCCDIAVEFTRKLPGTVLFRLLFQCSDDDFRTVEPWARVLSFEPDPARTARAAGELRAWAGRMLASRADWPGTDDVVTAVMHLGDSGETFAEHEFLSGLQILIQGGIGTAGNAPARSCASSPKIRHCQRRVRDDHSLIPALVEECLRIEPPTPLLFRTATSDVEVAGQQVKAGDKVGLFFAAANRDPAVFERPDEVDVDRPTTATSPSAPGPTVASGRTWPDCRSGWRSRSCSPGSARSGCRVGAEMTYASGQTRGLASLPLEFGVPAASRR